MRVDVDVDGAALVAAGLQRASVTLPFKAHKVTEVACANIQRGARSRVSGLAHAPHYPRSITYDVSLQGTSIVGEVGPDKDLTQGALGNLIEYGSVNNPPNAHLAPELDTETPIWLALLGAAAGDV